MKKPIDYNKDDIVVCLKSIRDRGGKHKESKLVIKDHFYKCVGVYYPYAQHSKNDVTCGLEGYTFILTASGFRKATESEIQMYESGAKSIN